jgi:hypothetical protein
MAAMPVAGYAILKVPLDLGTGSCNSCTGPSPSPPLPLHPDNSSFTVSPLLLSSELCLSDFIASESDLDVYLV